MKTCFCCRAVCAPDAPSCPACGEASFDVLLLAPLIETAKDGAAEIRDLANAINKSEFRIDDEPAPETPDNSGAPILMDPPTVPDAPKGRRSARRP